MDDRTKRLKTKIEILENERDEYKIQRDLWQQDYAKLQAERDQLQARLDAAVEALEVVEWTDEQYSLSGEDGYCPWCLNHKEHGHEPDCQRQASLKEARR